MTLPVDLSVPPSHPVEWRARLDGGVWIRWRDPLLFQSAMRAREEAARRLKVDDPLRVEVSIVVGRGAAG